MRRYAIVLVGLAMIPGAGCGAASDEDDAREAVKEYARAVADGDEKKVCDSLTNNTRKLFDKGKLKCEDAYKNFGRALSSEQEDKLKNIDPKVKIDGDEATTRVAEPPFEGTVRLKKEGGEWKVRSQ